MSSPIDSCTLRDSDQAQLDIDKALMDSPSAIVVYLLGICAPRAGSPIFCINKAQITSSKLVRTGIEVLFLLYHCYCLLF